MDTELSLKLTKMHKNKFLKNKYFWLLLLFGAAVVFCCVVFLARDEKVPRNLLWNSSERVAKGGITGVLKNKRLKVISDDLGVIWTSDKDHRIQDFLFADLDGNGRTEVILLLWKRGIYGKERPFWVLDNQDDRYSQHIFIYEISEKKEVRQKWCASYIGEEVTRMKLMEQNPGILLTERISGDSTLWMWKSFGLKSIRNEVRFVAFGDNLIHRQIYEYAYGKYKGNFDFLYAPFLEEVQSADIASIQLESILIDNEKAVGGYPSFGSPMAVGRAISDAGFDIAVCGSNHALDRGITGIDDTVSFFEKENILTPGVQKSSDKEHKPYEIKVCNGMKIALFAYTYGTNGNDAGDVYPYIVHYLPGSSQEKAKVLEDMAAAKKEADVLVVYAHWGEEYLSEVTPGQEQLAELFVEGGADIVIGTHPHVPQKVEEKIRPDGKKTIIFYSLGNFRAYQGMNNNTKTGLEAIIYLEHGYDGVRVKDYETRTIEAFVSCSE